MKRRKFKIIALALALVLIIGHFAVGSSAENADISVWGEDSLVWDDAKLGSSSEETKDPDNTVKDPDNASTETPEVEKEIVPNIDNEEKTPVSNNDEVALGLSSASPMAMFGAVSSIEGVIPALEKAKVVIVPSTDGGTYKSFPGTLDGLKEAVLDLHNNGNMGSYVLYVGSYIVVPANAPLVSEAVDSNPTAATVSFTALKGKVDELVITSSLSDPTTTTTAPPADTPAVTLLVSGEWHLGTSTALRNIRYNIGTIFANGNKVVLDRGSYFTAGLNVYGGRKKGDLTGNTEVIANATGSGAQNYYGGNKEGGTISGNTSLTINDTYYHVIDNISGGSQVGTVAGDVQLTIARTAYIVYYIYAGGHGTSAALPANVGGNVTASINGISGYFLEFYGGVKYGDIAGSVSTTFGGVGQFAGPSQYYGGSHFGSIGSGLSAGSNAITNVFDSSLYTAGHVEFNGANRVSGTIRGNINNKVTSFPAGAGYKSFIKRVSGAGGIETSTTGVGLAAYDSMTPENASLAAEASAKFKVYGDIYTEITKGIVSIGVDTTGYSYGAGMGGFVKGNTTIEVGTEGIATSIHIGSPDTSQNAKLNTRGLTSNYDIVGGGGAPGGAGDFFLEGNSKAILRNAIARWTYGANFSGSTFGTSRIELYGGIVDTLEGAGYIGRNIWGESTAYMKDGQVDWFFSGGGWNDFSIKGNVSAIAEGGTINAHLGGTYGAGAHTVYGNAEILVTGGDFSGTPRTGPTAKTFAGGVSNDGKITGDVKLTLDLRGKAGIKSLPTGSAISGGKPFNAFPGSLLGTTDQNKIELNIFTESGNNFLNGAHIYGDGGSVTNTKSGLITVNIDAPGSTVGNFYATQYSNILASKIVRNVVMNVHNVGTVNGMSGGNAADNFNNTIVSASTNKVTMNFNPESLKGSTPNTFTIGAGGACNFTDFTVNNALVTVEGGIKNGLSANGMNHATAYHQFGNLSLINNAGLSISSGASSVISANLLTIRGKSTLISPAGTNKVAITDIDINDGDSIYWKKNGGTAPAMENGYWFGPNRAYKVITFSPTALNAQKLTPYNFSGIDGTIMMLGDNETTFTANVGHGIAIPGSRIDFKVVEGIGTIQHNVDKVLQGAQRPLNGASTVDKDIPVSDEGWLMVVDSFNGAKLTFTPDALTGSWIKKVVITREDGLITEIGESTNSDSVEWLLPDKNHSYVVEVSFTNKSELSGRNVLITETEAAAIRTAQDIMTYQESSGRPSFTNNINSAMISAINQPLATTEKVRVHPVSYQAGIGADVIVRTYTVTVVKDQMDIHQPSRSIAIYAKNGTMMLATAKSMDATTLDTDYTEVYAVLADGTSVATAYQGNPISQLNSMILPGVVPVTYNATNVSTGATISKSVQITVTPDGFLAFDTIPELNFGQTALPNTKTDYWMPTASTLIVLDSRINPFGSSWEVQVKATDLDAGGGKKILANDIYYSNSLPAIGPTGKFPINEPVLIWESTTTALDLQSLNWSAGGDEGFSVAINPATTQIGNYVGVATWSLIKGA